MPNCRSQFVNSLFRSLMCEGAVGLGILLVVGVAAAAIFGKSSVESARNVAVSFATAMGLVISGIPLNLWLNSWGERFVELTATIVYAMMAAIAAYLFVDSGASSHWFAWIPFLSVPIALTVLFLRCARSEWMDFELERE